VSLFLTMELITLQNVHGMTILQGNEIQTPDCGKQSKGFRGQLKSRAGHRRTTGRQEHSAQACLPGLQDYRI